MAKKLSARDIVSMKREGRRIVMITAYDYPTARLADRAGIDIILVGDSAAMVMMGHQATRSITMEEMLVFCKAASRGVERALVVGDLPFMSYQSSEDEAVRSAGRMVKEGGVDAVKLEGGREYADAVRRIVRAGIPVMGHVGLTPQTAPMQTGMRPRGKKAEEAEEILRDALALQDAGAFSIVLEYATSETAELLSRRLEIPVIGVGSGNRCDGQVLVFHDVVGLFESSPPFAKRYVDLSAIITEALTRYREEVLRGEFPGEGETLHMDAEERLRLLSRLGESGSG